MSSNFTDLQEVSQNDEDKIGVEDDIVMEPSTVDGAISTPPAVPASVDQPVSEKINSCFQPSENDADHIMSTIPGLDSAMSSDGIKDSLDVSHTFTGELQGTNQELDLNLGSIVPLDTSSSNCMMTCTPETLSPSLPVSDAAPVPSNTLVGPTQYVLPKMIVLDVDLSEDQKDNLQKSAFMRILEAYKQVSLCGGSHVHLPLLAHLGIEVHIYNTKQKGVFSLLFLNAETKKFCGFYKIEFFFFIKRENILYFLEK